MLWGLLKYLLGLDRFVSLAYLAGNVVTGQNIPVHLMKFSIGQKVHRNSGIFNSGVSLITRPSSSQSFGRGISRIQFAINIEKQYYRHRPGEKQEGERERRGEGSSPPFPREGRGPAPSPEKGGVQPPPSPEKGGVQPPPPPEKGGVQPPPSPEKGGVQPPLPREGGEAGGEDVDRIGTAEKRNGG
eukprot:gene240-118_t